MNLCVGLSDEEPEPTPVGDVGGRHGIHRVLERGRTGPLGGVGARPYATGVTDTPADSESFRRYLVQIERSGPPMGMRDIARLLGKAGVEVDPSYGPILVNPDLGRYVVRATASREAREAAESLPGVQFFSDVTVKPTD